MKTAQVDPTQGKYEPKNPSSEPGVASIVEETPQVSENGAYDPKPRYPAQAQVLKDKPNLEQDLTDIGKRLLELEVSSDTETTDSVRANTQEVPHDVLKEEQAQDNGDDEYKPEDIDWSYLQMGEDFNVPDLPVDTEDPDFQEWASQMKQYLGHDLQDYLQARQEIREARKLKQSLELEKYQAQLKRQEELIKRKWGVSDDEYHRRMEKVVAVFRQLDPATQALLDRDPFGALKIWKDIEMSEKLKSPEVPTYEKSQASALTKATGADTPMFTGSQINTMPANQKAALWDKIVIASQKGLIDWTR